MARLSEIVVLSRFMKGRLVANGIPEGVIAVEPPEIAPPAECGAPGATPAVPGDIDLLFAGQLIRGKGLQVLLRAMAMARSSRTLDVIGSGNMERRLKRLAERLGIGGRVRWRGRVGNVGEWMRRARCVVVPSVWQEPYGLVAAEAAAAGATCIASDVGGLPEAAGPGATLVPAGDAGALAAALDS